MDEPGQWPLGEDLDERLKKARERRANMQQLSTTGAMRFGLVYWGLTPQQQPGSYQGSEMMMMKSVFWWRKPEYPEETTDLRQGTDETLRKGQP